VPVPGTGANDVDLVIRSRH